MQLLKRNVAQQLHIHTSTIKYRWAGLKKTAIAFSYFGHLKAYCA
jgi:sugar diacid utilization regulator